MRLGRLGFLLATSTAAGAALGLGYWPTIRWAGPGSGSAALAGSVVGLLASWVGAAPFLLTSRRTSRLVAPMVLASTALRSFAAMVTAVGLALSDCFPVAPLLIWVAISYTVLLPIDVAFAMGFARQAIARGSA